jgi:DNA replication protein DnaC
MKCVRDFWERHRAADPDGRILVLAGPYGVGKTTAAAWLVAKGPPRPYTLGHVDKHKDPRVGSDWPVARHPRFVCAGDLATMSPIDDLFKAILECSVLAIDDLGMEIPDADGRLLSRLDRIIDARYRRGVWTVITTNLTPEEFRHRYTPRIVSRLIEAGDFFTVPGRNMRA